MCSVKSFRWRSSKATVNRFNQILKGGMRFTFPPYEYIARCKITAMYTHLAKKKNVVDLRFGPAPRGNIFLGQTHIAFLRYSPWVFPLVCRRYSSSKSKWGRGTTPAVLAEAVAPLEALPVLSTA